MRNRVAYPVGNTNGRDHQYWPTLTKEQAFALGLYSDTVVGHYRMALDYPIAMTLAQIQIMSWRVLEWKVDAAAWTASEAAFDVPVAGQDDIAELNDTGTLPEFRFRIQRRTPGTGVPVDVTDEADMLSDWSDWQLKGDFIPQTFAGVPVWKTLRNLGVSQGFSNGVNATGLVAAPDPTMILGAFNFTEPYNHVKFGESGTFTGGKLVIFTMAGYIIYDPVLHLFYPPLLFSFSGATLPLIRAGRAGTIFNLLPLVPPPLPPPEEGFDPPIPCGFFTIEFGSAGPDQVSCQVYRTAVANAAGSGPPLIVPPSTGSLDLTMSPTQWWPYRTSGGLPVYDTTTGAQIRDPFS